jgi:hypothetical protein
MLFKLLHFARCNNDPHVKIVLELDIERPLERRTCLSESVVHPPPQHDCEFKVQAVHYLLSRMLREQTLAPKFLKWQSLAIINIEQQSFGR